MNQFHESGRNGVESLILILGCINHSTKGSFPSYLVLFIRNALKNRYLIEFLLFLFISYFIKFRFR